MAPDRTRKPVWAWLAIGGGTAFAALVAVTIIGLSYQTLEGSSSKPSVAGLQTVPVEPTPAGDSQLATIPSDASEDTASPPITPPTAYIPPIIPDPRQTYVPPMHETRPIPPPPTYGAWPAYPPPAYDARRFYPPPSMYVPSPGYAPPSMYVPRPPLHDPPVADYRSRPPPVMTYDRPPPRAVRPPPMRSAPMPSGRISGGGRDG
jgi:hypothetical protein